jgi:ABC-type sugar transport system ATPase subunit
MTTGQVMDAAVPAAEERPSWVLEAVDIHKRFGAVRALRGATVRLAAGEVVGLVGDNGAGKSTLVNVIAGNLEPDEGTIRVDGVERAFAGPADARNVGIETVFQNLSLIPTLDITENVYLARERLGPDGLRRRLRWMDTGSMRRDVAAGFERLGLTLPRLETKVAALSGGQRQAVAIARAVLWGSHIVVMDEPSAALGVRQTEIVLSFVERLKEHAVAVIFISHNMEQVLRVADRVVIMRLGQTVFDRPRSGLTASQLVHVITGADVADA